MGTTNSFVGHEKDVLSCAFSADNRQIISGSRDRSLKLWNILGECKATIGSEKANSHTEWGSCVRFSPNPSNPLIISCGWDKAVKVWDLKGFGNPLKYSFHGHTGYVNTVAVSPGGFINALEFSPSKYWLCAATDNGIRVWDLESRNVVCNIDDLPLLHPLEREDHHALVSLGALMA